MKNLFLFLAIFIPFIAKAYDFEKNGIYYTIVDEDLRTVAVSSSPDYGYSGAIVIPKIVKPDNSSISYIVTTIGDRAFYQCTNLTSIELPSSIENIKYHAFEDCINLRSFTFPESVKTIGNSLFNNCRNLTSVTYNSINATSLGRIQYGSALDAVFENCLNLSYVYIGDNVERIPKTIFAGIPITSIKLNKSLKVIEEGAFMNCTNLSKITFDSECNLTSVNDYAFSYCKALNNVTLPNSVTSIGDYAFQYCEKFTEFPFTSNSEITSFGTYAFAFCRGITELYLPPKVTDIGMYAFEYCSLKYIYFPDTILKIKKGAFDAIWTLPDIYCTSLTPPSVVNSSGSTVSKDDIFSNLNKSTCTLHVPEDALNAYLLADPWKQFPNIVTGISPASISVEEAQISLYAGEEYKFHPTIFPWFTQDCEVIYSSSNHSVAVIENDGTLHAINEGTAVITIRAGSCSTTVNVIVKNVYPISVTMSETNKEVLIGDVFDLSATVYPDNVTDKSLKWESTDENICIVDQSGHVTALGEGSCWVIAYCQTKSGLCKVTVKPIEVISVSINKNDPTLGGYIGNSIALDVIVLPADATNKTLTWSVEDPSIASVDNNGVLTFLSVGHTKVRATANNGVYGERDITVYPRMPQTFSISPESVSLNTGESFTFSVTMTPDNIDDRSVVWYSSDSEKVSIDENGTVTAIIPNSLVRIWGTAANGLQSSAYVEVKPTQAEEVVLSSTDITIRLLSDGNVSYSDILTATVLPESTTDKTITWTSSDESVAFYNESFDWHIAVGNPGTAILTATTENGKSASCTVTIIQDVTNISFPKYYYDVYIGETVQIAFEVKPSNATDKSLMWTSSDNNIASVSSDGEVVGINEGEVTIKATSKNGIYAECQVTVKTVLSESIMLDCTSKEIIVGESFFINATLYPNNTTDKFIQWISTDAQIASVSCDGEVVGIKSGECIISAFNGMSRADCTVKVVEDAAINEVNVDNRGPIVCSNDGCVVISGADSNSIVNIYDTAGNLIYSGTNREIPINIKGVYIVVIEHKHYKIAL